jgi:hypothetical protein
MDGVATDLAGSNPAAWKQTFDGFLSAHPDLGGGRPVDVDCLADPDGGTTGRVPRRAPSTWSPEHTGSPSAPTPRGSSLASPPVYPPASRWWSEAGR